MKEFHILIVENDYRRLEAMHAALDKFLPNVQVTEFTNAPDAIRWLETEWQQVNLVSLDFDLGTDAELADSEIEVGCGADVAYWLATKDQFCPVILHTDNFFTRPTMQKALDSGNWKHDYVAPGNGTRWVADKWMPMVLKKLEVNEGQTS